MRWNENDVFIFFKIILVSLDSKFSWYQKLKYLLFSPHFSSKFIFPILFNLIKINNSKWCFFLKNFYSCFVACFIIFIIAVFIMYETMSFWVVIALNVKLHTLIFIFSVSGFSFSSLFYKYRYILYVYVCNIYA